VNQDVSFDAGRSQPSAVLPGVHAIKLMHVIERHVDLDVDKSVVHTETRGGVKRNASSLHAAGCSRARVVIGGKGNVRREGRARCDLRNQEVRTATRQPRHGPFRRLARREAVCARRSGRGVELSNHVWRRPPPWHGIIVCRCIVGTHIRCAGSSTSPQKLGRSAGRRWVRVVCSRGSHDAGRCCSQGHVVDCSICSIASPQ
jgi:hypothetical protein